MAHGEVTVRLGPRVEALARDLRAEQDKRRRGIARRLIAAITEAREETGYANLDDNYQWASRLLEDRRPR